MRYIDITVNFDLPARTHQLSLIASGLLVFSLMSDYKITRNNALNKTIAVPQWKRYNVCLAGRKR